MNLSVSWYNNNNINVFFFQNRVIVLQSFQTEIEWFTLCDKGVWNLNGCILMCSSSRRRKWQVWRGIVGMKGAAAVLRIETNYISGCCEATASAALWPSIISSFHTSQKQRAGLICEGRGGWVRRLGVLELSLAAYTLTLLENHKELSVSQCVNQFNNTNSF